MTTQTCTACGNVKLFAEFSAHPKGKNGLRAKCRSCANAVRMQRIDAKREEIREQGRKAAAARRKNPDSAAKHAASSQRYYQRNRHRVASSRRERWARDPFFRMIAWQRMSLHRLLAGQSIGPSSRCAQMLGYTADELRKHIERQFTNGMTWDQMGAAIHIDHIIPVASFVKDGVTDPKVIHALSNLRPMWAVENRKKAAEVLTLL